MGWSKGGDVNGRRVPSGVAMLLSVGAALVLAACGSSSHTTDKTNTAAKKAAQQAQAEYQKCKSQLSSLLSAEENLNSHLDIGMNFTDYTQAVGNVKAAYDQTPIHQLDEKCLGVGVHTETALNDFAKAANTWNNCIGNINCSDSSIKPQLQATWSKASSEINQAKSALQNLQNPTSSAAVPSPTTATPATTPATSASTTESTLPKPAPGVTGPPANNSATGLPAWLGGGPIPKYWQVCGSGSQEVVSNGTCGLPVRQVFVAALAASGHPPPKIMDQYHNTYTCRRWRRPGVWRCTNTNDVWGAFRAP